MWKVFPLERAANLTDVAVLEPKVLKSLRSTFPVPIHSPKSILLVGCPQCVYRSLVILCVREGPQACRHLAELRTRQVRVEAIQHDDETESLLRTLGHTGFMTLGGKGPHGKDYRKTQNPALPAEPHHYESRIN